ncbi:MAG TPA: DUF4126 domain-containing protein [Pyrinomonadaceae bacterium]|jgi:hypothetical protein|nr:DUF4126 domain-containing protein [Pyrinomonadaceae bacterium]
MNTIQILGLALGSAWTSGINLYATVAALGLLERYGLAHLPGDLKVLANPWVLGVAIALYVVEFFADKIPYVDTVWDAVHTFVRVPAGAVLAYGATAQLDPAARTVALLVGGGLALSSHGTKATLRAGANLSPEPFSNWALSLTEDVIAVAAVSLAVVKPLAVLFVILVFLIVAAWLLPKIVRRFRRLFTRAGEILRGRARKETTPL